MSDIHANNRALSQRHAAASHISWAGRAVILNYANGTIIPTRRFDPRCYVPPDEIPRVRYSLIPRIKPCRTGQTPFVRRNEKKGGSNTLRERCARTATRNGLPKLLHVYLSRENQENQLRVCFTYAMFCERCECANESRERCIRDTRSFSSHLNTILGFQK